VQASSLSGDATPLYQLGGIDVIPLSEALGAEIMGVDLSQDFDDATFAAIHRAWLEYGVILIRNQQLTDADLVRIGRRFGELDLGPRIAWQTRSERQLFPEIYIVSNVVENGHPIGYLGYQAHSSRFRGKS
jgi:taurine dioxygenase